MGTMAIISPLFKHGLKQAKWSRDNINTFALLAILVLSGQLLLSVRGHQAAPTSSPPVFLPVIQTQTGYHRDTLIPFSGTWKYAANGSDQGLLWRTLTFDDSNWAEGFSELGYGDGDENTEVSFGSDPNQKHITTYFRRAFHIDDVSKYESLMLHLLRDDGAVVYLNGHELFRSNMPSGPIAYTTLATSTVTSFEEKRFHRRTINPAVLLAGENVLAVEIHQARPSSSDISFNLSLTGLTTVPQSIRLAAIGDYGRDNPTEQAVADLIQHWEPDFVLTLGDNSYGSSTIDENVGKYFSDYIGHYAGNYGAGSPVNRFFPSLGNHDYTDGAGLQAYQDFFTLASPFHHNERYYDYIQGDVHFFVIDSNPQGIGAGQGNLPAPGDGQTPDSDQGRWLQTALTQSTQAWNIVYFHHAPYSSSAHGDENASLTMRWPFKAWGATAVIAGHDHIYERFDIDGIPYFVNGLGVESTNRFCNEVPVTPPSEICHERIPGAMLIEADNCTMTFQFITHANEVIDTFTMTNESCP